MLAHTRLLPVSVICSTCFRPQPDRLSLQSQSFSRSYGSVLPTSLIYIVSSTRGCSPRRPDAVMSTSAPENDSLPRIFRGRRKRSGHRKTLCALPAVGNPISGRSDSRVTWLLKRKDNSSRGSLRRLRVRLRYRIKYPGRGPGILTRFPFDRRRE